MNFKTLCFEKKHYILGLVRMENVPKNGVIPYTTSTYEWGCCWPIVRVYSVECLAFLVPTS